MKQCARCQDTKPFDQFRKVPTTFGGDGYAKQCKPCMALTRAEREAEKAGTNGPVDEAGEAEEDADPNQPRISVPMAMAVDVAWNGEDFVLTQDNEKTRHTVFIAPHTLRRIWTWAEGLAVDAAQNAQDVSEPAAV